MSRLLAECGAALYGDSWRAPLARDLGVTERTVRRWAADTHAMPAGAYTDLMRLVTERAAVLDALAERLKQAG